MRVYILTRPFLFPSARALADNLTSRTRFTFKARTNQERIKSPEFVFFRWGNSDQVRNGATDLGINTGWISRSSNKKYLSQLLSSNNIPCVQFHNNRPDKFPIVVRDTLTGMGGEGISIIEDEVGYRIYTANRSINYWSYWYNFSFELGVHILDGRIVKIMKKVKDGVEDRFPIRNFNRGYHFSRVNLDSFPKLQPFVDRMYEYFSPNAGRLDIGWDSVNKTYRVIEFNSAPSLVNNDDTLDLYSNFFINKFNRILK